MRGTERKFRAMSYDTTIRAYMAHLVAGAGGGRITHAFVQAGYGDYGVCALRMCALVDQ